MLPRTSGGGKLEATVATLGPLHPFECEQRCSETILITVQQDTKEPHQKSSIIWGLLKSSVRRTDNGRLGRSPGGGGEAFEIGVSIIYRRSFFQPNLLPQQPTLVNFPDTVRLYFSNMSSENNPHPPPPVLLPPTHHLLLSPAGVLTHEPQQV